MTEQWERELIDRRRNWEGPGRHDKIIGWVGAALFCGAFWAAVLWAWFGK